MPVDHETLTAFSGVLDKKLEMQDDKRSKEFKEVHSRLDKLSETTSAAFLASAIKVAEVKTALDAHMTHDDARFQRIDGTDAKTDGWLRVGAAALLAGIVSWFTRHWGAD